MKRAIGLIALATAAAMILVILSACEHADSTAQANPTPVSISTKSQPLSRLSVGNISQIRLIEYRDDQPPEYPDPYKDVTDAEDIKKMVAILSSVTIVKEVDHLSIPVGETAYRFELVGKGIADTEITLYGDHILSKDGKLYETERYADVDAVFQLLNAERKLLPESTSSQEAAAH